MNRALDIKILRLLFLLFFTGELLPLSTKIGPLTIYTSDIALLPLFYWACIVFLHRRSSSFCWMREELVAAVMLIMMLISSCLSANPAQSLNSFLVWIRCGLIYLIGAYCLRNGFITFNDVKRICLCFVLFLCAVGSAQIITDSKIGMISNYFGENHNQGVNFGEQFRISGTASHPNVFGIWIVLFSTVVNINLLYQKKKGAYWLLFALFSWELYVIVATLSRGPLLYFSLTTLLIGVIWTNHEVKSATTRLLLAILVVIILGLMLSSFVKYSNNYHLLMERFNINADYKRIAYFKYGYELLKDRKILMFGTGLGTFFNTLDIKGIGYDQINTWRDLSKSASGIHNIFGMLLVETGLFTTLTFLFLYMKTLYNSFFLMKMSCYQEVTIILFVVIIMIMFPAQISNAPWAIWILPFLIFTFALVNDSIKNSKDNLDKIMT